MKPALSIARLAWRSFLFHGLGNLAACLSTAVAAAVITGALLVGDSVRGSLEDRVRERLGRVDHALVAGRFFREELGREVASYLEAGSHVRDVVPAILLRGTVVAAAGGRRASDVNVLGVPPSFWDLRGEAGKKPGELNDVPSGRRAAVNAWLADAVGAQEGDAILVYTRNASDIPAEHALGRRQGTVRPLRLDLQRVLPDAGLALFDLGNAQATAQNVFIPLDVLQRALGKGGLVNALLVAGDGELEASSPPALGTLLADALSEKWDLADAGLRLEMRKDFGYAALESQELLLPELVVEAALSSAWSVGAEALEVQTYVANSLQKDGREIPYSTVAATGSWRGAAVAGEPALPAAGREALAASGSIVLNNWAADRLDARPGDTIRLQYYDLTPQHRLVEEEASFTLRAVVPLEGAAADPGWTPAYPGVTDSLSMRDWDPPFPVDLKRIREEDEEYWKLHRATPKAFIALADGQRLWSSRFGSLTSIRIRPAEPGRAIEGTAAAFRGELRRRLSPASFGLSFRAVKQEGLDAACGGTDFAVLFLSFSSFLIISALILLSLVFRLSMERRGRELGILSAAGFSPAAVSGLLVREGALVVVLGMIGGAFGGLGYAAGLIAGLRSWWRDAVNAPFLSFHPGFASPGLGVGITGLLSLATIFLVTRRLARIPSVRLLSGSATAAGGVSLSARGRGRHGASLLLALAMGSGAVLLLLLGAVDVLPAAAAFFASGAVLLAAGIALVSSFLGRRGRGWMGRGRWAALWSLAARGGSRHPARSVLTVSLLACATFIIVAVAANRRDPGQALPEKGSGDGGFAIWARAATSLLQSLSAAEGREELNLKPETSALLERARVFAFRLRPGDDASCLNLYRPLSPRLLGAPRAFRERGGFAWAGSLAETNVEKENPWMVLEKEFQDGALPAVGDASTVAWILHSGLGRDLSLLDERGREVKLRLVGLLAHSIFQGELLISEESFLKHFPEVEGQSFFLIEADAADAGALSERLEADLAAYGFDADTTANLLASYRAVENTYLSTFQVLGGLGVLLGTMGLGAVLYRNVNERRGELALLRAVGFTRGALAWMVLSETSLLLVLGLLVGGGAAVVAVLPATGGGAGSVSGEGLALTLAAILVAGLLSSALALRAALRVPLLPALRQE